MEKKKGLFIRITEEDKKLFLEEAKKVSRSLSNFVIYAIKQWIQRKKEE